MHGIKIKARVPTSPTHLWPHGWGFKGSEVNAYSSLGPHSQKKDFFLRQHTFAFFADGKKGFLNDSSSRQKSNSWIQLLKTFDVNLIFSLFPMYYVELDHYLDTLKVSREEYFLNDHFSNYL